MSPNAVPAFGLLVLLSIASLDSIAAEAPASGGGQALLFGDCSDLSFKAQLRVERPSGVKTREARIFLKRSADGSYRLLIRIVQPSFLSGMKYLQIVDAAGKGSSWLRTSQGVRGLPQGGGEEPLFDSDLTASDLMLGSGTAASVEPLPPNGERLALEYRLAGSNWRRLVTVDAATMRTIGVETSGADGSLARRMSVGEYGQSAGFFWPTRCLIEDLGKKSLTRIEFSDPDTATKIPESTFSKASL